MTRALTSVGIVGVLICTTVAGCAYLPSRDGTPVVRPMSCTQGPPVLIKSIVSDPNDPSNRLLTVDHEPVHVCQLLVGTITWQLTGLAGQKYSFTDGDGIKLIYGPPQVMQPVGGKKQYDVSFMPPSPALTPPAALLWKYAINFTEDGNGTPAKKWTCDPTVVSSSDGLYNPDVQTLSGPATFTCVPVP